MCSRSNRSKPRGSDRKRAKQQMESAQKETEGEERTKRKRAGRG